MIEFKANQVIITKLIASIKSSMNEQQLQEVYQMVDTISLSRNKRNINRDFSDGLLMAEVINYFNPKIVSLHNYPASNSLHKKVNNWKTLNTKVLKKVGIHLTNKQIENLANSAPNAIEQLLYQVLVKFQKPDEEVKLVQNAKKIEKETAESRKRSMEQQLLLRIDHNNSGNSMEFNPVQSGMQQSFEDNNNSQMLNQKEEEELADLSNKIEQSYAQLLKLTELNKAKEVMLQNLQKKLQKILFS